MAIGTTDATRDYESDEQMTDEEDSKKAPWWVGAINKAGIPTGVLAVVLWLLYCGGVWTGNTIIVPLFERQVKFMDETSEMIQEQTRTSGLINKTLEAHGQHAIDNLKTCYEIKSTGLETHGGVKAMQLSHEQVLNVLKSIDENTKPLRTGMP